MAEGTPGLKETGTTDVLTKAQRSRCMSRIRGRDTKPEVMLRKALWSRGVRYRIHHGLPGRPDIVLPSRKIAIFVDGCFWHRCPLHWQAPKGNAEFWDRKIGENQARDFRVNMELEEAGWRVIRVWEHDVKKALKMTVDTLMTSIRSHDVQDSPCAGELSVLCNPADGSDGEPDDGTCDAARLCLPWPQAPEQ